MCKALLTFKCGFFPPRIYPKNLTHPYQCVSFLPPLTIVTGGERFLENCYLFHLFSNAILLLTENSGSLLNLFFKIYIHIYLLFYLLLERGEERDKERERNINVWLPFMCPLLGTWPAAQACALTGNGTGDSLFCRPVFNPLSCMSHGTNYAS